jgi:hypothetical protein
MKSTKVIWLVSTIRRLGYQPKVIVSYRRFEEYCASYHVKNALSVSDLAKEYYEVNNTAIMQLQIFGGCAVSFEELINPEEKA